ncbi:MAG: prephenate dehydrogenase [Chloroflexota bacterium]
MRIAVVGLGLIGGSLGLALKRNGTDMEVVGYARRAEVARVAVQRGAVDRAEGDLSAAVERAEVVFLATPVMAVREIMSGMASYLTEGCAVSDVGSTKAQVMAWADEFLPSSVSFIGGHPMAGKEVSGIEAADGELLRGCTYCLVPGRKAAKGAVERVEGLVRQMGASPLYIDAAEHDNLVAAISHLPMVLSAALVSMTMNSPLWPGMSRLAATGFRDVTRLASGSAEMTRDICLTNRDSLLAWLDEYVNELERWRRLIENGGEGVQKAFLEAREKRKDWLSQIQ